MDAQVRRRKKTGIRAVIYEVYALEEGFASMWEEEDYQEWARDELRQMGIPLRRKHTRESFCLENNLRTLSASDLPTEEGPRRESTPVPYSRWEPPPPPPPPPPVDHLDEERKKVAAEHLNKVYADLSRQAHLMRLKVIREAEIIEYLEDSMEFYIRKSTTLAAKMNGARAKATLINGVPQFEIPEEVLRWLGWM